MDYFILRQDRQLPGAIVPRGLSSSKKIDDFDEMILLTLAKQNPQQFLDFLENPRSIVSDKIKQILSEYNPDAIFKQIMFIEEKDVYWLVEASKIDCLSPSCEFQKKGALKRLILEREKVKNHAFFSIEGIMEQYIIVNLEVAEKILRQDPWGIIFQRVETL